jgi:hypothetical protein
MQTTLNSEVELHPSVTGLELAIFFLPFNSKLDILGAQNSKSEASAAGTQLAVWSGRL